MSTTNQRTIADLEASGSNAPFELFEGELRDESPSDFRSSEIAITIASELVRVVRASKLGHVTGEQGGYILSRNPDSVVTPDVAFISRDRLSNARGFVDAPPDFAVDVVSPSDRWSDVTAKAAWSSRAVLPSSGLSSRHPGP